MDKGRLFEQEVLEAVRRMGFEASTTRTTGDGGIDIVALSSGTLVAGKYIIQCKNWAKPVGEPELRDLYGVVHAENANKGIMITTSTFTTPAREFAKGKQLELIDGDGLRRLLGTKRFTPDERATPRASRAEPLLAYLRDNPRNIRVLKQIADLYVDSELGDQDWQTAIGYYDQIVAVGPPRFGSPELTRTYAYALNNKGACHLGLGDVPEALHWLSEAQRRVRRDSIEWQLITADLGKAYHYLELYDSAVRTYRLLGEKTPLLTDELDLALMQSQPIGLLSIGLRDNDTVLAVVFFPDPGADLTRWTRRSRLYASTIEPFWAWLSAETQSSDDSFGFSSVTDILGFSDNCVSVAANLGMRMTPAVIDHLQPYVTGLRMFCEKGARVLCSISAVMRLVAKTIEGEPDPDTFLADENSLRALVKAVVLDGEIGIQINALTSEVAVLQTDLERTYDNTVRDAKEYLRSQKHRWRAAIR